MSKKKSLTDVAKSVLTEDVADQNKATLSPKDPKDPPKSLGSAEYVEGPIVGPNPISDKSSLSSRQSSPIKKDTSRSSQNGAHDDPPVRLQGSVPGQVEEESEVEVSEELEDFINSMVAEGATEDEILAAIEENFDFVTEEGESIELPPVEIDLSEHVEALLSGENLSEEFKTKATSIFEAAVKTEIEANRAQLEEAFEAALDERVSGILEDLEGKIENYLNYIVEGWIKENEVAIQSSLRTEITEDFIAGLKNLFAENFIDIPEDKVDVVEALSTELETVRGKLNEELERNIELSAVINEATKDAVISHFSEGLTDVDANKLKTLAENIEYITEEDYAEKVEQIRESYFKGSTASVKATSSVKGLDKAESSGDAITESASGPMSAYVQSIAKSRPL
jgi:hypothetical protein